MKQPITVEAYDPQWPLLYEAEKARLFDALGEELVAIEHVGSTSVPGLGAKPVIDMMAGVVELSVVERWLQPLTSLGYEHIFSQPQWCHFAKKSEPRVNLHIHVKDGEAWMSHLLFRDYLRAHPAVAKQYQALKQELAASYLYNPAYVVNAKAAFIEQILAKARQWRAGASCSDFRQR